MLQILVLCSLGLVVLIPRIILANQLDLVTDEIIYILAGKSYMPLLRHITTTIGSDGWQFNYEHPPLVKFFIGFAILINGHIGHPFNELLAARIPSIVSGTTMIMAIYWLGRKPFGHIVSLLAALSLAFSPWLVYFSSLAYLDMTMTAFITIAYLLTWHATHRPWLYLCVALFVGLGIDSKYTATLIIPGILFFTAYYFFVLRLRLPVAQRSALPWHWWLMAGILTPLCFFLLDPVIWSHPIPMFMHSVLYEWNHSVGGHLTFLAGSYDIHVPHWAILYIIANKVSTFVTVPATIFCVFALIQLIRFHLPAGKVGDKTYLYDHVPCSVKEATTIAFLLIWLLATLGTFSLLNIVVGTHYLLPLAPPVAIAGAYMLVSLGRYVYAKGTTPPVPSAHAPIFRTGAVGGVQTCGARHYSADPVPTDEGSGGMAHKGHGWFINLYPLQGLIVLILGVIIVGPHLLGLLYTPEAEGYTSEFFHGENQTLQVAYPGYREAVQWLDTHTQGKKRIGLAALPQTLWRGDPNVSWFAYNSNIPKRFQIQEAHPNDPAYPYDYLIWPMHLTQRGYALPPSWHIIHIIIGGETTYCFIAVAHSTQIGANFP